MSSEFNRDLRLGSDLLLAFPASDSKVELIDPLGCMILQARKDVSETGLQVV